MNIDEASKLDNEQLNLAVTDILSLERNDLPDPFMPATDPTHALLADKVARSLHEADDDPEFFARYVIGLRKLQGYPFKSSAPPCRSICIAILAATDPLLD